MTFREVQTRFGVKRWRIIPEYPEYRVTDCGRVWSCRRRRFIRIVKNKNGYDRVELYSGGKYVRFFVHRLVAQAFCPNPKRKPEVNHKDWSRTNNHYKNLEWVTRSENVSHSWTKPRHVREKERRARERWYKPNPELSREAMGTPF